MISTFWNVFDPPSAKQKLLSLLDMWNLVVQKLIGHVSKVSWLTIENMPISFSFPMYLYKRVKKERKIKKRTEVCVSFLNYKTGGRGFQSLNLLHCTVERAWKFSEISEGVKWFILIGFLEVILIRGCRIQILDPNHINSACLALFFWFLVLFFFVFLNWYSISFYWGTWIKPQHLVLELNQE